uniref:Protein kinase domain-containing protein n=1 Tax=Ascaris lumbricoides TaxID=6252 RepID=A0A0M3IVK0_ASCLU
MGNFGMATSYVGKMSVYIGICEIRHVILTRKVRNGGFDWIAIEDEKYSSLKELINDYVTSGRPINPEYKTSILIRGIKRQRWEFSHEDVEMKDILGEGQYGEVRAGFLNTRGKKMEVAIKIVSSPRSLL